MKKALSLILLVATLLTLASCGSCGEKQKVINAVTTTDSSGTTPPSSTTDPDSTESKTNSQTTSPQTTVPQTTPAETTTPPETQPTHKHNYTSTVTTKPTCTKKGVKTYTCSCGDSYTEDINKTAHSWKNATCTSPKTCSVCGETTGTVADHSWKNATCTAPKTCSVCGETTGTVADHSWEDATCTNPETCYICGATQGEALGHSYVAATCTRAKYCSVCYETFGSPISHSYNNGSCTMCSKADPNAPTFKVTGSLPIKKNGCKITNVTTSYSGSTLYITISGTRESGTGDVGINFDVFPYGYGDHTASGREYIRNVSAGSSFTLTVALEDAIRSEYKTYNIWIY